MLDLQISFAAAFVGGTLSLLPACGPALMPAFFAYSFAGRPKDALSATISFALGFSLLFVPFALGVRGLFDLLSFERQVMYSVAGTILLLLGLAQLLKVKWPVWYVRNEGSGHLGFVGLGMVFGLTSSACIAPIFGGIATLAATQDGWLEAAWLLVAFELGMFVPLLLLAWGFGSVRFLQRVSHMQVSLTFGSARYSIGLLVLISSAIFLMLGAAFLFPKFSYLFLPEFVRQYFINLMF